MDNKGSLYVSFAYTGQLIRVHCDGTIEDVVSLPVSNFGDPRLLGLATG